MTWLDDMKADALQLSAPDFELLDGDEVHVDVRSCEGVALSSVTFEEAFFAIDVEVWRPTSLPLTDPGGPLVFEVTDTGRRYITPMYRCYLGNEAQEFLVSLMHLGSQAHTATSTPAPEEN